MSVLSGRALQQQLSVIMEALTRAAVAEIVELVDGGYAALQLEISRSRQENQDLRKKLHLIESIVVRGGKAAEEKPKDTGEAPRPETPQQHRDEDGREGAAAAAGGDRGAAVAMREEFPDVVLIKDEDSDSSDAFEDANQSPVDSAARDAATSPLTSRRVRRRWRGSEEAEKPLSSEQPGLKTSRLSAATQQKAMSVYSVDSPQSEPSCSSQLDNEVEMKAGESLCSFSSPMEPDLHLVQECPLGPPAPGRPVFFSGGALIGSQSPSGRADLDMGVDQAWSKQTKAQIGFASFHQSEHVDADAFGLKLISVSGSTSTDCQLSEGSGSAFEYEDGGDMMSFGLYREQPGRSQPGSGRGKRFICSICSKTYATSQNLDVHMRIHTGQRPFSCDQCGKKFTQSAHLKSHLSVHSGERPHGCTLCSRSFIVKYSLKLHMKKCHPNV